MDNFDDMAKIGEFEKRHPDAVVAYGGDGRVLEIWRDAYKAGKTVVPVRNYGRCEAHADPLALVDLSVVEGRRLLRCEYVANRLLDWAALSEMQVKSADVTAALRMDVYVNGVKFFDNVIADGVVCSTVFGSTGYFSSISRTLFRKGFGLAFVAPTLGVSNLVLEPDDVVYVRMRRDADVVVANDKDSTILHAEEGRQFKFALTDASVKFAGLDVFHCPECRARRHGTRIVNQYLK